MVEDNKNNDTKEELKTSSNENDMDIQEINENKDLKNTEIDQKKEVSDNQLEKDQSEKIEEKQDEKIEQKQDEKIEQKQDEKVEEKQDEKVDVKQDEKVDVKQDEKIEQKPDIKEGDEEENDEKEEVGEDNEKDDPNAKWYIVGAASGFEEKAVKTIQDNARKASLNHFFFDFQIPKQEVVEIKRGKKINSEKNFFPGYMLIKMIMNNQTWQLVKNTNKISGFTGNDHKPIPLSQNEAMKMLKKADDSIEYIAPKYVYEVGQQVKVIEGPFASFNGMVEEVDEERGRLKISVSIFGRSTPVELEYTQVEKI